MCCLTTPPWPSPVPSTALRASLGRGRAVARQLTCRGETSLSGAAARAIGRVWERSATAEVDLAPVLALTGDEVALPTRLPAIELLSKRAEEKAVERLKTLSAHPDWAVRAAAVRALLSGERVRSHRGPCTCVLCLVVSCCCWGVCACASR